MLVREAEKWIQGSSVVARQQRCIRIGRSEDLKAALEVQVDKRDHATLLREFEIKLSATFMLINPMGHW